MAMRRTRIQPDWAAEHGRYIYAYCHVRTNQVVYSLSQTLKNSPSLNQLPDLGANHKDARLRKDLWQPLYTLCLPSASPHTLRQGLHAFKKLREYRKLHELNWTPSPLLAKPKTDTEIQLMKDKLGDRGGSKKENVYDLIVREKKKMRVRSVLDQKANSIADLAAVLMAQEELGNETIARKAEWRSRDRAVEVETMLALAAEAEGGALERLENEAEGLRTRIERLGKDVEERDEEGLSKSRLKRELFGLMAKRAKMEFAFNAVRGVRDPSLAVKTKPLREKKSKVTGESELEAQRASRASKLRSLAAHGVRGGLQTLDQKIAALSESQQQQHDSSLLSERDVQLPDAMDRRSRLDKLLISRKQMELATAIPRLFDLEGAELDQAVDTARLEMERFKVGYFEERLRSAEEQGFSSREVEALEHEVQRKRESLQSLEATGMLPREKEMMEREARRANEAEEEVREVDADAAEVDTPTATTATAQDGSSSEPDYTTHLPPFPTRSGGPRIPKRGPLKQKLLRLNSPVFSTENVTIKWNNILDAEFAAQWPSNISHERMGWVRNTAPRGDRETVESIAELKPKRRFFGPLVGGPSERENAVRGLVEDALSGIRQESERKGRRENDEFARRFQEGAMGMGMEGGGGGEQRVSL